MNKPLFITIAALTIIGVLSAIASVTLIEDVAVDLLTFAGILALVMMLINGTFYSSKFFSAFKFVIGIILVGAVFMILHIEGANEIIYFGYLSVIPIYSIHFFKKQGKTMLDFFKLVTVVVYCVPPAPYDSSFISLDMNWISWMITHVTIAGTFIVFVVQKRQTLFRKSPAGRGAERTGIKE